MEKEGYRPPQFKQSCAAAFDCMRSRTYRDAVVDVRFDGKDDIEPVVFAMPGQPANYDDLRESRLFRGLLITRHVIALAVNEPYEISVRQSIKQDPLAV